MVNIFLTSLQIIPDNKNTDIVSLLIWIICGLVSAIVYLFINSQKTLKEKDDKILKCVEEYQKEIQALNNTYQEKIEKISEGRTQDLKDYNTDLAGFVDKFHLIVDKLKEIANG